MNKYRIIVSDNTDATFVDEYLVESEEDERTVVKAMALSVISDSKLDSDYVEKIICEEVDGRYVCVIQCADCHMAVWCAMEPKETNIDYIELAKSIPDDEDIVDGRLGKLLNDLGGK